MKKNPTSTVFNHSRLLATYLTGHPLRHRVESHGTTCPGNLCLLRSIKDKGHGIKCPLYSHFMITSDILPFVGIDLFSVP